MNEERGADALSPILDPWHFKVVTLITHPWGADDPRVSLQQRCKSDLLQRRRSDGEELPREVEKNFRQRHRMGRHFRRGEEEGVGKKHADHRLLHSILRTMTAM